MAAFIKGDIVVVPFPFSDLTQSKRRPALILTSLDGDDLILMQITSQNIKDKYAILINDHDFTEGQLKQQSNVRPNRLFTADRNIILYKIGHLKSSVISKIVEKVIDIIRQ